MITSLVFRPKNRVSARASVSAKNPLKFLTKANLCISDVSHIVQPNLGDWIVYIYVLLVI